MENEHNDRKLESIYSKRLRAGKRRTYFFDVRSTKGNDYYLTITESRKRFDDNGYDRHKVFLYKEDFNKFIKALNEAIDFVKTDLMPDFNFDAFNHEDYDEEAHEGTPAPSAAAPAPVAEPQKIEEAPDNDEKVIENPDPKTSENDASSQGHEEVEKW
ncbi:DNA-binding protein [Niabella ginsenosidivorans]|uniref:DNA-binding protein n=1 Tax=Niabella ginsenosidivorans TaxID=1176587 RepID=A0A1A9I3J7_9BACT|nr:DUF3276 family protein [Niabella ginsenosidivorans]ANH81144.1 DNA-binding protein [Niabella ginsenosidivorans]